MVWELFFDWELEWGIIFDDFWFFNVIYLFDEELLKYLKVVSVYV